MYEFKFPDVGEGIIEGELVKWLVKEGDKVMQDQPIAEVETDKALVHIPAPVSGTIQKLHFKENDTIKVGDVFVTIAEEGEPVRATPNVSEKKQSFGVVGELEEAPEEETKQPVPVVEKPAQRKVLATPAVRKLAKDLDVDLVTLAGTGPGGRVIESDVRKAKGLLQKTPEVRVQAVRKYDEYGHVERAPFKSIRKATAKKMVAAWTTIPHVTHMDEVDVTDLVEIREREKARAEKQGIKLTYLPFIMKAVIAAMKEGNPYVNATLDETREEIILKKYYNIGCAVDTPDGLLVPVIKGADEKSILDIAKEMQTLADVARARTIDLGDLKGGTFTITNVGSLGGIFATPIINSPEAAIMALGRIYEKPVFVKDKVTKRFFLPLSLTFDHRVLDGAAAARFVNAVKEHLEDPSLLLIERD